MLKREPSTAWLKKALTMSKAASADSTQLIPKRAKPSSEQNGKATAKKDKTQATGPSVGAKIVFDTLQYAMFDNLAEAFHFNVDLNPNLTKVKQPQIHEWTEGEKRRPVERLTATDFRQREQKIAHYLRSIGVRAGSRVAIISADGPCWAQFEAAIWDADGEVVNIYVRNTAERTGFCLIDSGAKIVIAQNQEQLDKLFKIMDKPFVVEGHEDQLAYESTLVLEKIITINPTAIPEKYARFANLIQPADAIFAGPAPDRRLLSTRGPEDIANIVYTSGSSGAPKGVLCTHGATLHNLRMIARSGVIDFSRICEAKTESDLPHAFSSLPERAHAFPMRIGHVVLTSPAIGVYPAELDKTSNNITPEFRESIGRDHRENAVGIEPTVPKVLSALRKKIITNMDHGGIKGKFAKLVALNAARHIRCRSQGKYRPLTAALYQMLAPVRKTMSKIIKTQFAQERFDVFISGGAALPLETDTFFWALRIPILEGYGSSETNCPVFINRLGKYGIEHMNGTVGYAMAPDVRVKLDAQTSEILISAPCLASGYLNRPSATAKAWFTDSDGVRWYRTKDVGEFVGAKFLRIKGRCDDVLVLDNGENVGATEVSDRFDACRLVHHGIVFGHKKPALIALVTLNYAEIKRYAQKENVRVGDNFDACPIVRKLVEQEIKQHVNSEGRVFEKVRSFAVIPPLSIDHGTLTGKEEPVRRVIEERYTVLIESLYIDQSAWIR
jgi:long-chain acyl-CoA synthetase